MIVNVESAVMDLAWRVYIKIEIFLNSVLNAEDSQIG